MDEVRDNLAKQDRAHLSNLWEDKDTLHSLNFALSQQQLILAKQGVGSTTDFEQVMLFRGQIEGLKWVMSFLKYNHKQIKQAQANKALTETAHSQ